MDSAVKNMCPVMALRKKNLPCLFFILFTFYFFPLISAQASIYSDPGIAVIWIYDVDSGPTVETLPIVRGLREGL